MKNHSPPIGNQWIALKTIVRKEIRRVMRIWKQTILPPIVTNSLYFLVFGYLMGNRIGSIEGIRYIDYIVPGLIMMAIIINAYASVVASFFVAKFQKSIEELLVAPVHHTTMLCGFLLGGLFRGGIVGLSVTGVAWLFTPLSIQSVFLTTAIAVLTALLFALAGLINGMLARTFEDINIVPTFILTPLTYLGGVFYSVQELPAFGQAFIKINPIFYIVSAFRYAMLGQSEVSVTAATSLIIGCIVLLYGVSLWMLKTGVGIKH